MYETVGYHGTDSSVSKAIIDNGFICKKNDEHWLGNGIYLYQDLDLAKWWTTNPTKKHGMKIDDRVIIECRIEAEDDKVLNLCSLKGYKDYVERYNSFFQEWAHKAKPHSIVSFKQLRCAFFDYVMMTEEIHIIIAPFILPDQPYMPSYFDDTFANEMHIMYPEIQICISETNQNKIIKDKRIHIL